MPCDTRRKTDEQLRREEELLELFSRAVELGQIHVYRDEDGVVRIQGWEELPFKEGWNDTCLLAAFANRGSFEAQQLIAEQLEPEGLSLHSLVEIHGHGH